MQTPGRTVLGLTPLIRPSQGFGDRGTYRAKAKYADGRKTDLTGEQANALYAPIKFIGQIGARINYVGRVNDQISTPFFATADVDHGPERASLEILLDSR